MPGHGMTVLKVEDDSISFFESNDEFRIEAQSDLHDVEDYEMPELSQNTRTIVEKKNENSDFYFFEVDMSSKTKDNPIYVHRDGIEKWDNGYQRIDEFSVWLRKDPKEMFIFAPKAESKRFIKRLRKFRDAEVTTVNYDFSRIEELENLENAWGLWRDTQGIIQRVGEFGDGIEDEIDDPSKITTLYIDYEYGDSVQLVLSEGGSISTKQNITKDDLFSIFEELRESIVDIED